MECRVGLTEFERGKRFYLEGEYDIALSCFLSILDVRPDDAIHHNWVGLTYYHVARYGPALQHFNEALQLSSRHPSLLSNRGACYLRMNKINDAEKDFDKSLRYRSNHPPTLVNRANAKKRQGKFEAALVDINTALAIDGGTVEALNNRGTLFLDWGYYEEAADDFKNSFDYHANVVVEYQLLQSYIALGEYDKAIEVISNLLESKDHYYFYVSRAVLYSKLKMFDKAEKDIEKLNDLLIDRQDTYLLKHCEGVYSMEQNNWDSAKDFFDVAWQGKFMNFDNCESVALRGYCNWRLGNFSVAKSDLDCALGYRPKHKIWAEWRAEVKKKRAFEISEDSN
eukprot:TRINITY_DN449_c0_g1_i1.p1 TRINITY_DN449_c0_g1~~TRINITY_DN449_c0_g1_i1.p1  ORF type:complete len:339 (+),score=62.36 TRINITY_DN449_c0_g1_i1:263-1279(+)